MPQSLKFSFIKHDILCPCAASTDLDARTARLALLGKSTPMGDPKPAVSLKAVQADLVTLGYLPKGGDDGVWGGGSKRALKRFKRRAASSLYRMSEAGAPADCAAGDLYKGPVDENIDQGTLDEIKKWIDKKWKVPLGRFKYKKMAGGTLREDVADEW